MRDDADQAMSFIDHWHRLDLPIGQPLEHAFWRVRFLDVGRVSVRPGSCVPRVCTTRKLTSYTLEDSLTVDAKPQRCIDHLYDASTVGQFSPGLQCSRLHELPYRLHWGLLRFEEVSDERGDKLVFWCSQQGIWRVQLKELSLTKDSDAV